MIVRPDHVTGLWDYLERRVGFRVANKRDSVLMAMGARVVTLVTRGEQSADDFLRRYVTAIPLPPPWGFTVFVPFDLGVATPEWSLESQLLVGVHEAQHGVQWHRLGVSWISLYVSPTDQPGGGRGAADRARFEAECKGAAEVARWRFFGTIRDPAANAEGLRSYACSVEDVLVSREELRLDEQTIRAGGVPWRAARLAIDWRDARAPELAPRPMG